MDLRNGLVRLGTAAPLILVAFSAQATETADAAPPALDTITVVATGVSNMTAASAGDISQAQMAGEPVLRPAAILENIPGLIVTQHSGEGKANQYFLRAFNLDHGTDLALEVDDMPVNMPSHAHGQGYADFNFVIPQSVVQSREAFRHGSGASIGLCHQIQARSVVDLYLLSQESDRRRSNAAAR